MRMTLAEVAAGCGGVLHPAAAADLPADGAAIDGRRVKAGDVFVALAGAARDGHDFVAQAAAAGAAGALVRRRCAADLPQITVDDTPAALTRWAAAARARLRGAVVAVTGSNGKTTVKEMLLAICRAAYGDDAVCGSRGNFNNLLGVPLTLLGADENCRALVAETGMDNAGELTALSALLRPQVAVINNAQRAHLGNFASLDDIAAAKGEVLSGLAADGIAVLNADDRYFSLWRDLAGGRRVLAFGFTAADAAVRGEMTDDGVRINGKAARLQVLGAGNRRNALAAAAAAFALDVPAAAVIAGLESFAGADGRLRQMRLADGTLLIDDTYNANPDSAAVAVDTLRALAAAEGARAILVMGDMLALGDAAGDAHRALLDACADAGIAVFACGDVLRALIGGGDKGRRCFADKAALTAALLPVLRAGKSCVLVKGSRGMRMEEVVAALRAETAL